MGGGRHPKIVGQVRVWARKYEAALRVDLLNAGLRFDRPQCTWRDLHAMFTAAPPGTAMYHAVNEGWSRNDHLAATVADGVNTLLWTKTKDAQRKPPRNRPEPIKRPGVQPRAEKVAPGGKQAVVMSMGDFAARMRESRERARTAAS